jgi:hypothetical protein
MILILTAKLFAQQVEFIENALYRREFISKALHDQQVADKHYGSLLALMQRKSLPPVELHLVGVSDIDSK